MRKLVLAVALAVAAVALTATLAVATRAGATPGDDLQAAKAASARYHSVEQALKDGYSGAGEPCVTSPGAPAPSGAMGIHYVNGALIGPASAGLDALQPEIMLYVPKPNGELELVGVEYFAVAADQTPDTQGNYDDSDRPSVLGVPLDGPMAGHAPGMPVHYDVHVWFWEPNPNGMFAPFNAELSC
jgi:hypothetical protein